MYNFIKKYRNGYMIIFSQNLIIVVILNVGCTEVTANDLCKLF